MRWVMVLSVLLSVALAQTRELKIFGWEDYFDPQVIKAFEQQFKVKVSLTVFESNEQMLKTLERGGTSRFDIVIPSDFVVPQMIKLGYLQALISPSCPNSKTSSSSCRSAIRLNTPKRGLKSSTAAN